MFGTRVDTFFFDLLLTNYYRLANKLLFNLNNTV